MTSRAATESVDPRPLQEWISRQPDGLRPDLVSDAADDASVVGLGANTRESHEVFRFVERVTHSLLERGFDAIAIHDNQRVVDLYDRFVGGENIDIDAALAEAWGPWRTVEMRDALIRLRERNATQRGHQVRMFGISPAQLLPGDYDRIPELIGAIDSDVAADLERQLAVIRVAHESGEHVLHAHGTHPGTPFVEIAHTAHAAVADLPASPQRNHALELLAKIVDFHGNALDTGHDDSLDEHVAAERVLERAERTGGHIVFWEGIAHIGAGRRIGAHLREALGDGYVTAMVTFGRGYIDRTAIPAPRPDSIEAQFAPGAAERTIDLRAQTPPEVRHLLEKAWATRTISGMYKSTEDHDHYLELSSLPREFDVLAYIPEITPTHDVAVPLPTADTVRYSTASDAPGGSWVDRRVRSP